MADVATSSAVAAELRPMSGRRSAAAHLGEIIQYRELLVMYTAVFAILRAGFDRFAIWVLCGLLVWTLISSSLITSTVSITSNASLVGKVRFPRAVLPLASVGGALVHFVLQAIAFAVVLAVTRHP